MKNALESIVENLKKKREEAKYDRVEKSVKCKKLKTEKNGG